MTISHMQHAPLLTQEALATVAHELRDPLAAVLFALEALLEHADPDVRRARSIAQHQARRAVQIVDDLFELCAASQDRLRLHKEIVELAVIVAGATEVTAHLFAAREHRLTVSLPTSPVFLSADPLRLEQVLTNLLANAAKYTDPGGRRTLDSYKQSQAASDTRNTHHLVARHASAAYDVSWRAGWKR
jgi:signal transduction histidine kinase